MAKVTVDRLLDESTNIENVSRLIEDLDFESGFKFLEQIVQSAEGGNLSLEKAVLSCERGALLSRHLRKLLQSAEERLQVLSKD